MLTRKLTFAAGERAIVRTQGPVVLSELTLFLPDLAVLKPRADWYRKSGPSGSDTYLVIEVSDTTLRKDRDVKLVHYARHGAPEVWIADVAHETLHFFRGRTDRGYADISSIVRPSVVTLPTLGDTIDLTGLFGPD
jgi:Uma2 family endonuclease